MLIRGQRMRSAGRRRPWPGRKDGCDRQVEPEGERAPAAGEDRSPLNSDAQSSATNPEHTPRRRVRSETGHLRLLPSLPTLALMMSRLHFSPKTLDCCRQTNRLPPTTLFVGKRRGFQPESLDLADQ